jgi:hypothetical protein
MLPLLSTAHLSQHHDSFLIQAKPEEQKNNERKKEKKRKGSRTASPLPSFINNL